MKVPLEILTVFILIYLGWRQSFQEQFVRISGKTPARAKTVATPLPPLPVVKAARPTPADHSWMRRATTLDRQQ